mmetsp:Transcript_22640/g.63852  ORF Transcript_22640/g.63852 Transcript_22640/m.63852 type:complete len:326 (+) Transcript_22640:1655-2632(+)
MRASDRSEAGRAKASRGATQAAQAGDSSTTSCATNSSFTLGGWSKTAARQSGAIISSRRVPTRFKAFVTTSLSSDASLSRSHRLTKAFAALLGSKARPTALVVPFTAFFMESGDANVSKSGPRLQQMFLWYCGARLAPIASRKALNSSGGRLAQRFSSMSFISAPGSTPRAMTDDAMTDKLRPSLLPLTGCGSPLRCSPLFRRRTPLRRRRLVGGGCSVRRSVSTLTCIRRLAAAGMRQRGGAGAKPAKSQGAAARASMATAPGRRAMLYATARTGLLPESSSEFQLSPCRSQRLSSWLLRKLVSAFLGVPPSDSGRIDPWFTVA